MVLGKLLSGGLVDSVGKIVDDLHVSEEEKAQAKAKLLELENQVKLKQMDINLADAKSTAGGISGMLQRSWRPLIGMSCALAIFWEFVLSKFILLFSLWIVFLLSSVRKSLITFLLGFFKASITGCFPTI